MDQTVTTVAISALLVGTTGLQVGLDTHDVKLIVLSALLLALNLTFVILQ